MTGFSTFRETRNQWQECGDTMLYVADALIVHEDAEGIKNGDE